jgi:acyl-CoA hydrolase
MRTTHVQIVMHSHVNNTNRLFGGRLMEWIDVTAASAARRHAAGEVTTATVDALEFIAPVYLNDLLILEAEVTWTGRTSIEVRVQTYCEALNGDQKLVNRAYLLFVAVDEEGNPNRCHRSFRTELSSRRNGKTPCCAANTGSSCAKNVTSWPHCKRNMAAGSGSERSFPVE